VTVSVVRDRATLVRDVGGGRIENVYRLQIVNSREQPRSFVVSATGLAGANIVLDESEPIEVAAASTRLLAVRLRVDAQGLKPGSHPIKFLVTAHDDPHLVASENSTFFSR
jgi:polyferredoxin